MQLTQKLLQYFNRPFSRDPEEFLALRVISDSGHMTWTVQDGTLTLTPIGGIAQPLSIDLSKYTVQGLAVFIASTAGYFVIYQDSSKLQFLSALVLLDGSGDIVKSNGDHLYAYTSLLYAYLEACSSELEVAQRQIPNMLAQLSTTSAGGEFLDIQGSYYKTPRNNSGVTPEGDPSYGPRIISNVLLPSSNNIGMAIALEAQFPGSSFTIADAVNNSANLLIRDGSILFNSAFVHNSTSTAKTGGLFDVTFAYSFASSVLQPSDYAPLVIAAVNRFRAGGTYIRNLVIKNGTGATVALGSFDIGSILVTVLDKAPIPTSAIITEGGSPLSTEGGSDVLTEQ